MAIRKIVHIDMDAFYASVEQRDDPHLRGKPVVVAWRSNRSVVCAASYEARAFGVRSAMPALHAERLCPAAIFIPPDFPRYRAVSNSVREILKRHTDLIEPLSLDEAYLDVTANRTGLPTATRVARVIREQIREELYLTASAGVAPNKFLAKIASDWRKPDGLFVVQPEDVHTFLTQLQEIEPMIRRLAEKVWSASRKESRIPRTVILKLKTKEFRVLTRSLTLDLPPSSCEELTNIALSLRERVELGDRQHFRLVGVGLSNFQEAEVMSIQPVVFE